MADTLKARLLAVRAFLDGSEALDGLWFGDDHPTKRGAYWWRSTFLPVLDEAAAALPDEPTPDLTASQKRLYGELIMRIRQYGTASWFTHEAEAARLLNDCKRLAADLMVGTVAALPDEPSAAAARSLRNASGVIDMDALCNLIDVDGSLVVDDETATMSIAVFNALADRLAGGASEP